MYKIPIQCNMCSKFLSRIDYLCKYQNDKGVLFCSNCYDRIDELDKERRDYLNNNYEGMKV